MGKLGELLAHPLELKAALILKTIRQPAYTITSGSQSPDLKRCYELLTQTSRSFAAVIMELHPELRDAIALFYLILRALDTIEDDMTIPRDQKVKLLQEFDQKLDSNHWSFNGNGPNEKDRAVLVEFPSILHEYHELKPEYQMVIKEITKEMAFGMVKYILDDDFSLNGVATIADYDLYCHYVAGLVGDGLTQLIVLANFGSSSLYQDDTNKQLFESMGLFLQKTNIIRDYAEDLHDGRTFWPKEIWQQHTDKLANLQKDPVNGLACINHLVLNAMSHIEHVLTYLSLIEEQSSFQFCAIPQVMAIATLSLVFNNENVLHKNVKIRKGETCYLILKSRTLKGCVEIFTYYLRQIKQKLTVNDPNYLKINIQIAKIEQFIEEMYQDKLPPAVQPNKTPIYLSTANRTLADDKILPLIEEENYKFNICLTIALVLTAAIITQFIRA